MQADASANEPIAWVQSAKGSRTRGPNGWTMWLLLLALTSGLRGRLVEQRKAS
ncbi:hypothetical protein LY76DRAFT_595981 [Colletotrichum caudatum]|nr:hypothetical protein LY76DRAFT_595981 [Colletotrichum caudatum]